MAAVSIQETTVVPTEGGYAVELLVSDGPPSDETTAAFVMSLRVRLPTGRSDELHKLQLGALEAALEVLKPVMRDLYRG